MSTIHHLSQQPWKFDVMELEVGDRGFLKITFSSVTTWTVRGARGWDQMHPPPPLPVPPVAARTPYIPGLRGPRLSCCGAGDKLWEETTPALPLWPHWTSESEAQPAGSWTAARPGPHLAAEAKAQILPELRRLRWLTLHTAPTGYRLVGSDFPPSTQLSPAGLGAQGALGKPAPSDWLGKAMKAPMLQHLSLGRKLTLPQSFSLSPARWKKALF